MRVALLKADYVNEELIALHGDLPDMFERYLATGACSALSLQSFEVRAGSFPDLRAVDAILISGSRFSVNDTAGWIDELMDFVRMAHARQIPVVGFCFGHQLLARAFGGRVGAGACGWNVGLWPVHILQRPAWLTPAMRRVVSLFNHREQVIALPPTARLLAGSRRCPVQMFEIDGCILGMQFHPEYTVEYQQAIMAVPKSLPPLVYQDALRRNTQPRTDRPVRIWLQQFIARHRSPIGTRNDHDASRDLGL